MGHAKLTTVGELRRLIGSELLARPAFAPVRFAVVIPSRSYRYETEAHYLPDRFFWRACRELMEHGGYIRIDGADSSSVFFEVSK